MTSTCPTPTKPRSTTRVGAENAARPASPDAVHRRAAAARAALRGTTPPKPEGA